MIAPVLSLITGLAAASLAGLLSLIARFYQRTSGEASGYGWFAVPALLLLAASARDLIVGAETGDVWAGALRFLGGVVLVVLCSRLFTQMTTRQRR